MSEATAPCRLLFTVEQAAERLGVPKSWLYERTRHNAVPCRRLGKYVRFSAEDLSAIINSTRSGNLENAQQ